MIQFYNSMLQKFKYHRKKVEDCKLIIFQHHLRTSLLVFVQSMFAAKYYSIIVDGTPDSSHVKQTTFIIRYLTRELETFVVQERFLTFVDCCKKTGLEISILILETLKKFGIPLAGCRGQGYDDAAKMSGKYNGISLPNSISLLKIPCACTHPVPAIHSISVQQILQLAVKKQ